MNETEDNVADLRRESVTSNTDLNGYARAGSRGKVRPGCLDRGPELSDNLSASGNTKSVRDDVNTSIEDCMR